MPLSGRPLPVCLNTWAVVQGSKKADGKVENGENLGDVQKLREEMRRQKEEMERQKAEMDRQRAEFMAEMERERQKLMNERLNLKTTGN